MLAILTVALGIGAVVGDSLVFWSLFGAALGLLPVVTTSARE